MGRRGKAESSFSAAVHVAVLFEISSHLKASFVKRCRLLFVLLYTYTQYRTRTNGGGQPYAIIHTTHNTE